MLLAYVHWWLLRGVYAFGGLVDSDLELERHNLRRLCVASIGGYVYKQSHGHYYGHFFSGKGSRVFQIKLWHKYGPNAYDRYYNLHVIKAYHTSQGFIDKGRERLILVESFGDRSAYVDKNGVFFFASRDGNYKNFTEYSGDLLLKYLPFDNVYKYECVDSRCPLLHVRYKATDKRLYALYAIRRSPLSEFEECDPRFSNRDNVPIEEIQDLTKNWEDLIEIRLDPKKEIPKYSRWRRYLMYLAYMWCYFWQVSSIKAREL